MAERYRITFLPMDRSLAVDAGTTVLEAAMAAGVHINASCGGNGTCGKCRVVLKEGRADPITQSGPGLSRKEQEEGIRLACQTRVADDLAVEVPFESQVDRIGLKKKRSRRVLAATDIDRLMRDWSVNPSVFKRYVELPAPTPEDNVNDFDRLVRGLNGRRPAGDISASLTVLNSLSGLLRQADWRVTATLCANGGGFRLIRVEAGNHELQNYSIVIDIGTTTIWGQIIDISHSVVGTRGGSAILAEGRTRAEAADYNGQISYGADVISRIVYAQKPGGLERLRKAVVSTINSIIEELLKESGIDMEQVSHMVLAGNTTMTHLVLGLDPKYIMLSPYTPTMNSYPPARAKDLGLKAADHVFALFFPSVASYVGGDIVAGVLGSGLFQRDEVTLFMDIGTNGEIVVGNREFLTCTSCSAGPAFEGGGIRFGTRAGRAAIEQVSINPSTFEPMVLTIGSTPPSGICGSGLIDVVAECFRAGIIDQNGKFRQDLPTDRVRCGEAGWEYLLVPAEQTAIGKDITVCESDLDNLIRTKAAVYAGCKTLLDSVGLAFDEIDRIIIAGGFGHHLDVGKAQQIGLLPDLAAERFVFVGNGSLLGARLLSFSKDLLDEALGIARSMTNIELANNPGFMEEYVAALFIPHTDERAFPHVMKSMRDRKRQVAKGA